MNVVERRAYVEQCRKEIDARLAWFRRLEAEVVSLEQMVHPKKKHVQIRPYINGHISYDDKDLVNVDA